MKVLTESSPRFHAAEFQSRLVWNELREKNKSIRGTAELNGRMRLFSLGLMAGDMWRHAVFFVAASLAYRLMKSSKDDGRIRRDEGMDGRRIVLGRQCD